jgi:ABC-type glycerol-3-phosphate transport system permease component
MMRRRDMFYWLRVAGSIAAALAVFFPVYWLIVSSFKPLELLFAGNRVFPALRSTTEHYAAVMGNVRFWRFVMNSTIVGAVSTSIVIVLSTLGAYSLARLRFPGSDTIANTILFVYMVPPVLLAIPIYMWMYNLGLLNSRTGVIFAHVARGMPYAVWMLRGFFSTLPADLEDAARIDGCTYIGVIARIILPLSGPGIVAVATYTLIISWNDYLMAFMLITRGALQTLPVGLVALFEGSDAIEIGSIMAGSVLSAIPVVLFFYLVQRVMIHGIAAGAVKG